MIKEMMEEISHEAFDELIAILNKYNCNPSEEDLKRIIFLSKWIKEKTIQKDEDELK